MRDLHQMSDTHTPCIQADRLAIVEAARNPDKHDIVLEMFDFGNDKEEDDDVGGSARDGSDARGDKEEDDLFKSLFAGGAAPAARAGGARGGTTAQGQEEVSGLGRLLEASRGIPILGRLVLPETRESGVQADGVIEVGA